MNINSDIPSAEFFADQARIGRYAVNVQQCKGFARPVKYTKLFEMGQFIPLNDPKGMWTFDQVNQILRRQRVPGKDHIGDLRVSFEVGGGFGSQVGPQVSILGKQTPVNDALVRIDPLPNMKQMWETGPMMCEYFVSRNGR